MSSLLSRDRARKLVREMSGLKVVVIGDLMLDRFLWGTVSRVSPEAPVPVVRLSAESAVLGGAGNVGRNLLALGGRPDLVGVVGRDGGAERFREALRQSGLSDAGLVEVPGRTTTIKTRVIAHHQQVVRIDREASDPLPVDAQEAVRRRVTERLPAAKALLVSDYDKGVVSPDLLRRILPAAVSAGLVVAIDPKPPNYDYYRPATVITPNFQEARIMAGLRGRDDEDPREAGEAIRKRLDCTAVLLTEGDRGMTLFKALGPPLKIPAAAREVFDVTGAGDTVIATLTLALAAGASVEEAAILANVAAGCSVGKLGTAVVGPEELVEAVPDPC